MEENTNMSCNPFKMLGSWLGLIIFGTLAIIAATGAGNELFGIDESIFLNFFTQFDFILKTSNCHGEQCMIFILTTPLVFLLYGFLIGWLIQCLMRKLKKKQ